MLVCWELARIPGLLPGLLGREVGQVDPWQVLRRVTGSVLRGVGLVHRVPFRSARACSARSVRDADQVPRGIRRPPRCAGLRLGLAAQVVDPAGIRPAG